MFYFTAMFDPIEIAERQAASARLMSERLTALAERVFVQAETAIEPEAVQAAALTVEKLYRGVRLCMAFESRVVREHRSTSRDIKAEAQKAGLAVSSIDYPTVDVAGKPINSGERARAFAGYMRIHTLEATGGLTFAQMPRFATADGKGTNDKAAALKGDGGQPLDNPARAVWISETSFSTALNVSYMAEQLALFGVVVGIALLLSGIGFIVLAAYGMVRVAETVPENAP